MPRSTDADRFRAGAREWWHDAVVYRIRPRSFADSSGNGVGDLEGIRQRLGYVELLGVDAIWLTTVLRDQPDQAGPTPEVDPLLGDIHSFEQLISAAHARDLRLAVDVSVDRGSIGSPHTQHRLIETVRFWLERGVDAFRLCTLPGTTSPADGAVGKLLELVHPLIDSYPNRAVGAIVDSSWFDLFANRHSLQIGIDFRLADAGFDALKLRESIESIRTDAARFGLPPVWVRANRDPFRPVMRYGNGTTALERARAMLLVRLALPGVVGIDNCEELGVCEAELPGQMGEDPIHSFMPWEGDQPPFGFSQAPGNWWPINKEWAPFTVEAQLEDPSSILSLYRHTLELRKQHPAFKGAEIEWFSAPAGCFAFRRVEGNLLCALNTSNVSVPAPPGELMLSSNPLPDGRLPPDTAVWLT